MTEVKCLKGLRVKEYHRQLSQKSYFQLESMSKTLGLNSHLDKSGLLAQLLGIYDYQLQDQEIMVSKEVINEKIILDLNSPEDLQII